MATLRIEFIVHVWLLSFWEIQETIIKLKFIIFWQLYAIRWILYRSKWYPAFCWKRIINLQPKANKFRCHRNERLQQNRILPIKLDGLVRNDCCFCLGFYNIIYKLLQGTAYEKENEGWNYVRTCETDELIISYGCIFTTFWK